MKVKARTRADRFQYLVITLLLLIAPGAGASSYILTSIPGSEAELQKMASRVTSAGGASYNMFLGESILVPIALYQGQSGKISSYVSTFEPHPDLQLELFKVSWVSVDHHISRSRRPDILTSIKPGQDFECERICLLLVELTTKTSTAPANYEVEIEFFNSKNFSKSRFRVLVENYQLNRSAFAVQASVGRLIKTASENEVDGYLEYFQMLKKYGINFFSIGRLDQHVYSIYRALMQYGMQGGRLGVPDANKHMRDQGLSRAVLSEYVNERKEWLSPILDLINMYPDKLHVKLADEPESGELEATQFIYSEFDNLGLPVRTEIAGVRSRQSNVKADINVVRLQDITDETVEYNRARRSATWLYANTMHSLRNPVGTMKLVGLLAAYFEIDGYHFWNMAECASGKRQKIAGEKECRFGRGTFSYFDAAQGQYSPSLRLLMFRQGLDQYAMIQILRQRCGRSSVRKMLADALHIRYGRKRYVNFNLDIKAMVRSHRCEKIIL